MRLDYPRRKRVYLSGPFADGDTLGHDKRLGNVADAQSVAMTLLDVGYSVLCPHLTGHYAHDWRSVHDHDFWLSNDLAWVEVSDAVYRIKGSSKGADEECEYATRLGIPVFTDLANLKDAIPFSIAKTYEQYPVPREKAFRADSPMEFARSAESDNPDVHQFSTGAVRSRDADDYAFELMSPIAMQQWLELEIKMVDSKLETCVCGGKATDILLTKQAILFCLVEVFRFLAGDTSPESLIDGLNNLEEAQAERVLFLVAKAYKEGKAKYSAFNWERGMDADAILNHAIRHLLLAYYGDTGDDHIGHAGWNLMAAYHSLKLWPQLNAGKFRGPGCKPPNAVSEAVSDA